MLYSVMLIRNRQLARQKKPPAKMVETMDITEMPHDPAQRWEWIKYQLRIHGCPPAELARQLGVTDRAIRAVKSTPYPRVEKAIAAQLGTRPVLLWPERWNSDGTPCRQRPNRAESRVRARKEHSSNASAMHRKSGTEG
ncbi:helix-turn-helix domain-containing protein [Stutzerimonas balearica]|uniref:helix-turn-helix domain-containing protein n=1 Tax=Stutzerimonas balearica TaxID=74829 RepID=UPI001F4804A3|nr:helix-turn-helix domain-containing protein [Stutzerimonas balearica]